MANKTQTISKTTAAKKGAPAQKQAPKSASRIISTNDAAQAKQVAAGLPATNTLASAAAYKARKGSEASKASKAPSTAGIVAMIVEGISKRIGAKSPFYATALAYHARNKTAFPRARNNETRAAHKVEDVTTVFDQHDKKILASGNAKGQAMFDVYMMQRT